MSLSVKERHALASIEERLTASDRKLASMLDTFFRLTAGEAMPKRERVRAGWPRAIRARDREHYRPRTMASPASRKRARLLMVLWVVISLALVAVAAVTGRAGPAGCAMTAVNCAGHQPHGARQPAALSWPRHAASRVA